MKNFKAISTIIISALILTACAKNTEEKEIATINTRTDKLEFNKGYPSNDTVEHLYNEIDFQRACQAYLWSLPIVASMNLHNSLINEPINGNYGDFLYLRSYEDLSKIITANATTPYYITYFDLNKTGPVVIHDPKGKTAGLVNDAWQRLITDIGVPGKYNGKGGKHLILGPNQEVPSDLADFNVVKSKTNIILVGLRNMETDQELYEKIFDEFIVYPYSKKASYKKNKTISHIGEKLASNQARGLDYWQLLSEAINNEPIEERDRFFTAMLKPLGIEKGKPFNPNERQKEILKKAVIVGEAMARVNDFSKRNGMGHYSDKTNWEIATVTKRNQRSEFYEEIDERAAWFYEAITISKGMTTTTPGVGSRYLVSYRDKDEQWLDGAKNYKLHVPPNVPAKRFWSVTVYNNEDRYLIQNKQKQADRSSRQDLITNNDGSVDIYFGPKAPKGKERNWIQTNPEEGWFSYFRLYGPLEPYFDKSWILPSIEKTK